MSVGCTPVSFTISLAASDMKVLNYGLKKEFIDRYDVNEVLKENRLTKEQIVEDAMKLC